MAQIAVGASDADRREFLWAEVVRTRAALSLVLRRDRPPTVREDLRAARGGLLVALEAYRSELSSRGQPIPYQLRDEVRLCRLTLNSN